MPNKAMYFRAETDIEEVLAGVPCRFLNGRYYEVEIGEKDLPLAAELKKRIDAKKLTGLTPQECAPHLERQLAEARERRTRARQPMNVTAPTGRPKGHVKVRGAPK